MIFSKLVDEYIIQWPGKDVHHQQQRCFYWVERFGEYRLADIDADMTHAELQKFEDGKCMVGHGRGKKNELNRL